MPPESAPGWDKYPDYVVDIQTHSNIISVFADNTLIASSTNALAVHESRHEIAYYLPLEDIEPSVLTPSPTETYCPFKGTARYWHVTVNGQRIEDALWSYDDPYIECMPLRGHAAFYTSKVNVASD